MALGVIEIPGLVQAIEAADAMTKASEVHLIGRSYVTALARGETGRQRSSWRGR